MKKLYCYEKDNRLTLLWAGTKKPTEDLTLIDEEWEISVSDKLFNAMKSDKVWVVEKEEGFTSEDVEIQPDSDYVFTTTPPNDDRSSCQFKLNKWVAI